MTKRKTKPKAKPARKRGAQPGNKNAFRHGFYGTWFTNIEKTQLEKTERISVESEIDLIRVFMSRLVGEIKFDKVFFKDKENNDTNIRDDHYLKQLNTLALMNQSMSTLIRTDNLVKGKHGQIFDDIMTALEETRLEMGL